MDRAAKRLGYPPPLHIVLSLSASIFFNRPRRSLAKDAITLLNTHKPRPLLAGVENLPHSGAFVVVANHHHRAEMWMGWVASMLIEAIYTYRPLEVPIRIVVTDAQRFTCRGRARVIPLSGWFLGRIAALWGMIRMPGDPANAAGRATSLRQVLGALRKGEPVLFFPEGDRGTADGLVEALPGTGTFLALAARQAKIVPVAFWEDGPLLRGCVGTPISISSRDDAEIRQQLMVAIGLMLPRSMGGAYANMLDDKLVRRSEGD